VQAVLNLGLEPKSNPIVSAGVKVPDFIERSETNQIAVQGKRLGSKVAPHRLRQGKDALQQCALARTVSTDDGSQGAEIDFRFTH
jgi:hypothetical protein